MENIYYEQAMHEVLKISCTKTNLTSSCILQEVSEALWHRHSASLLPDTLVGCSEDQEQCWRMGQAGF